MTTTEKTTITVSASINAPIEKVWELWTAPKHIMQWNNASPDWHTPKAENDLRTGGRFSSRMEAKDGSFGFDFGGVYDEVKMHKVIAYTIGDGRKVKVNFTGNGNTTEVVEAFEAEGTNPVEMQRGGWQAILNNFKKYVEAKTNQETLHFEISIHARPEKVYKTMLDEKGYNEWTSVFNPTSRFRGSWEKGAKILFIGTDKDGKEGGMVSRIRENIPNRFVSIEHLGELKDGKEITTGPEIEKWAGAQENYTYKEDNGKTLLVVELDSNQEFKSYFEDTYPKSLQKLKEVCER
jgi:uncharacterized protein YndB with AHSA1/START domain